MQQSFAKEHGVDISALDADGAQDADLFPTLVHGNGERVEDDVNADQQGDKAGDQHAQSHGGDGVFQRLAFHLRAHDIDARGQLRAQPLLQFVHGHSRRIHQIDAIEVVAAIEDHLSGVDVHDGDVAAEYFANAGGLERCLQRRSLFCRSG